MAKQAKQHAAATPALKVLTDSGHWHATHAYTSAGSDFGAEAADVMGDRLGVPARRILKTLVVAVEGRINGGPDAPAVGHGAAGRLAVALVPVDRHLDLKAVASALGVSKAAMADAALAQRVTGYVLGGVSPLGQKTALTTVIDSAADAAAERDETVFFSAGKRGLEIEMRPSDLVALLGASVAPIAAG